MKRIMSFDGGGIRGVFSLRIAARIEHLFREHHGRPDLVLADVVDLFAGTSTGAIIATFLSWGYPVSEVERLYVAHAKEMFAKQWFWRRFRTKYQEKKVAGFFKNYFKEDDGAPALLRSSKLKTLLLIIMANASTGSPWPVSNNPHATFNAAGEDCNLEIPIWKLLRASTAAPTFFQPEEIQFGSKKFLFVDGGVTPFNNPSLIAVLTATLPCYHLGWEASRDKLQLMSIGTGGQRKHFTKDLASQINVLNSLDFFVHGIMGVVNVNQDVLCRVLGHCLHGSEIDSEMGCLNEPSLLATHEQKFSYARYNVNLDSAKEVGTPMTADQLQLDNLTSIEQLQAIARDYAERHIKADQLLLDAVR